MDKYNPLRYTWRDYQLRGFINSDSDAILEQEKLMLDFVSQYPDIFWRWQAEKNSFYDLCRRKINLDNEIYYNGIIIFGSELAGLSTRMMVAKITNLIHNVKVAYVAINRYNITQHDIDLVLPDSIADSLDAIINLCDSGFKRLHSFKEVDGNHMIGAHPMDCYGLCRS